MSEDELQKFISTASPEQFLSLRIKIEEVKSNCFDEKIVPTLNKLIDLII